MEITHRRTGRARLLTAGVALALLTTGCATTRPGDDDRTEVGTEKTSATTGPTLTETETTPTQPDLPAAARNVDAAGARAAARYLLELEHYASATGDLDEWKRVSLPDCEYCAETTTRVEEARAAGRRSGGGDVSVEGSALPVEVDGTFLTRTLVSVAAGTRYDAEGAVLEEVPAFTVLVDLDVRHVGGTWRVADGTLYLVPYAVPRAEHPDRAV